MADAALRLTTVAEELLGFPLPVRVRAWDGSESGPPGAPVLVVRHRRALRRLLWRPGELGLARAWVAGEIDVEGDLYAALDLLSGIIWEREEDPAPAVHPVRDPRLRTAARALLRIGGALPPPPPPPEEVRRRSGPLHTRRRDRQAISHHYDVGNGFYEQVLGPSMVYSCAYWSDGGTLEEAQRDKLDLVCRKLALQQGDRLLDVGCGWGSLAMHAAREYGAQVTGITLSREQAAYARKRIAEAGLTDRIEIRVQDYRDVRDGPYDAIASIGMAEHVGQVRYLEYAEQLLTLLRPGGRLLNHQIARRPERNEADYRLDPFIDRVRVPRRRARPPRPYRRHPGAGRLRGTGRRVHPRALRPDPAPLGGQPGGGLAPRRASQLARAGARLAAVHGRLRPRLRAQQDRRQPGPCRADPAQR